ncbi:MAG: hypothetical protein IGBAC_1648 [Ignavibacteriae bacterium]|nr:MAG: hypothetical protein IGBAC_1648 [Ignavibacteriota bacterium]
MQKQFKRRNGNSSFKKKHKYKKKQQKQLELQFQLKEFMKLQKGAFSEQPILSIREYEKKKRNQKNLNQYKKRIH